MAETIRERIEALVAEVERALQQYLSELEARESAFVAQCIGQEVRFEPNYVLPDFPKLSDDYYRQLEGECRLLEKALTAWLRKADELERLLSGSG
ncbi:MAG: hypothetical protein RMI91_03210 [Gemmatales bacterium]|nr:hypothetical protein [Gemmatales bacterium]MDW7993639.1 hypothetical protein [Gemmatales bacterium]